jgi:hypothetical protein
MMTQSAMQFLCQRDATDRPDVVCDRLALLAGDRTPAERVLIACRAGKAIGESVAPTRSRSSPAGGDSLLV